jgi:two-component system CheB/CheR fusion protein
MLVSVDPKTSFIIECNQTLLNKTGYSKSELIGKPILTMYHKSCKKNALKALQSFINTGKVVNAELTLTTKANKKIPVLLNVESVKNDKGEILYSNSSWRDMSTIKSLEQKIKKQRPRKKSKTTNIRA